MARVSRSALVPFSSEQMFDLINNIEAYPEFMTGCSAAEILNADETSVEARLTLSVSGIEQSFVTRNELLPPKEMKMHLVEGPFSSFEGVWRFESLEDKGCKVGFDLDFSFNNPLLRMTAGPMLEKIASQQVDALCERANKIYK